MKKLIQVTEVEGEGLEALLGQEVLLMCGNYFYAGELTGVNDTFVQLTGARIVYETGPWTAKTWQDAQKIAEPGDPWYVMRSHIESFGPGKK